MGFPRGFDYSIRDNRMPKSEVQIDFKKFLAMLARLERRITQRFPDGSEPGLLERMRQLAATASAAPKARRGITSPLWVFRLVLASAIVFLGVVGYLVAGRGQTLPSRTRPFPICSRPLTQRRIWFSRC